MTHVVDDPVSDTLPLAAVTTVVVGAEDARARPGGHGGRHPRFLRRHRAAFVIGLSVILAVMIGGAATFVYAWNTSGPRQLSLSSALQRFRSGTTGLVTDPGALHPQAGVYSYTGSGDEHVSLPPKSQTEGPKMPGTVSYQADGCWVLRIDYSDSHWQNATYCPRAGNLVEVGRAGWYRWNFVALEIADTATFTCPVPEMAIPKTLRVGESFAFSCRGTNTPLQMPTVDLTGTNTYVGLQVLHVGATAVTTVHFHEVESFSGGQTGTDVADTWFSTVNGLPVRGVWSTRVNSPTPVGTSTLTGRGSYTLASLTPRS